jgi:hypothetical protein
MAVGMNFGADLRQPARGAVADVLCVFRSKKKISSFLKKRSKRLLSVGVIFS